MIDMAAQNRCVNASFTADEAYTCNRVQELTFLISYAVVGVVMFFGNSFVCLVFFSLQETASQLYEYFPHEPVSF